jgi:hypothetical protein
MDESTRRRRFHLALAVDDLDATIADYTVRLGEAPAVVVDGRYAVWRTPEINLSVSVPEAGPGSAAAQRIRHVGFEDGAAVAGPRTVEITRVYGTPTTSTEPS